MNPEIAKLRMSDAERVRLLREALRPFTGLARMWVGDERGRVCPEVTLGHLRRADVAMEATAPAKLERVYCKCPDYRQCTCGMAR